MFLQKGFGISLTSSEDLVVSRLSRATDRARPHASKKHHEDDASANGFFSDCQISHQLGARFLVIMSFIALTNLKQAPLMSGGSRCRSGFLSPCRGKQNRHVADENILSLRNGMTPTSLVSA
jgi:hypothetical protein